MKTEQQIAAENYAKKYAIESRAALATHRETCAQCGTAYQRANKNMGDEGYRDHCGEGKKLIDAKDVLFPAK